MFCSKISVSQISRLRKEHFNSLLQKFILYFCNKNEQKVEFLTVTSRRTDTIDGSSTWFQECAWGSPAHASSLVLRMRPNWSCVMMRTRERNAQWIEPVLDGHSAVSRAPSFRFARSTVHPFDARKLSTKRKTKKYQKTRWFNGASSPILDYPFSRGKLWNDFASSIRWEYPYSLRWN